MDGARIVTDRDAKKSPAGAGPWVYLVLPASPNRADTKAARTTKGRRRRVITVEPDPLLAIFGLLCLVGSILPRAADVRGEVLAVLIAVRLGVGVHKRLIAYLRAVVQLLAYVGVH